MLVWCRRYPQRILPRRLDPCVPPPPSCVAVGWLQTVLVILVFVICFEVPDFGDMVSLVGGLVNSLMGFILPPLIYLKQQVRFAALPCCWRHDVVCSCAHGCSLVRRGGYAGTE